MKTPSQPQLVAAATLSLCLGGSICAHGTGSASLDRRSAPAAGHRARAASNSTTRPIPVPQFAHSGYIRSFAFSPDSRTLGIASSDNLARLWDIRTGALRAILWGHQDEVYEIAFSPNGRLVATAGMDASVRLWNTNTGTHQATLQPASNIHLQFSADSARVYAGLQIWAVNQANAHPELDTRTDLLAMSPDGETCLVKQSDTEAQLWDTNPRRHRTSITGAEQPFVYSPSGRLLALGSQDGRIHIWDVRKASPILTFEVDHKPLHTVAFTADDQLLAVSAGGSSSGSETDAKPGFIDIWDMRSGKVKRTLTGHSQGVDALAFNPKSHVFASAGYDETVQIWDADTGRRRAALPGVGRGSNQVQFSPDGKWFAHKHGDSSVRLCSTADYSLQLGIAERPGSRISISPDGNTIVAGRLLRFWNGRTFGLTATTSENDEPMLFSPDGKLLVTGRGSSAARIWYVATKRVVR